MVERWYCSARFATGGGRGYGSWSGFVQAEDASDAHRQARAEVIRRHPTATKLDIKAEPPLRPIPSRPA